MARGRVIRVSPQEAKLKRRLRQHLKSLGFQKATDGTLKPPGFGKETIRTLHRVQREERLTASREFVRENLPKLRRYFASGKDVDPTKIRPALERVSSNTWQSDLFRLASLTWSVPVSNGYGRRLRYLVWDKHNNKLIGLFAIGDPVFNLSVRDNLIGWSLKAREKRLVNIMDAYVLGAVPPYNMLLGGKLVASLIRTREVYRHFGRKYGKTKGIISKRRKGARLLVVTTSSSMGRSSLYNRLKLNGTQYFKSIGYTGGWGHFHIPDDLFEELRTYLRARRHKYADRHRFGQGPNWRLRTTRAALKALGFREDMLRHGIQREAFICKFADNAETMLRAGNRRPDLSTLLSSSEVARLALTRWVIPRAERRLEYLAWSVDQLESLLQTGSVATEGQLLREG